MQLLNSDMLMEKRKKNEIFFLKRQTSFSNAQKAKLFRYYMCTSRWNISLLLNEF